MYPTLNSKGISCFPKAQHGAAAGVILFFTALAAAIGPLAMAAVSDAYGTTQRRIRARHRLRGRCSSLGLLANWLLNPPPLACRARTASSTAEPSPRIDRKSQ